MTVLDALSLNILRVFGLIQGLVWGELAKHCKDPDVARWMETRSLSGWVIWGQPDILPPEILDTHKSLIKGFLIGMIFGILIRIWWAVTGGLQ